jgi:hypothetical protein
MILVSHPTRPPPRQTPLFEIRDFDCRAPAASATGRSENKLLPRLPALRADRRLVTRHVPKSLFILTRSAPKHFRYGCASSIKMPLLPLPNCQRTNRKTSIPKQSFGGHFAVTTTDGLKQARRFFSKANLRNCFKPSRGDRPYTVVTIRFSPGGTGTERNCRGVWYVA